MQVQAVLLLLDGKETHNSVPTSDFPVQQNCRDIWVLFRNNSSFGHVSVLIAS